MPGGFIMALDWLYGTRPKWSRFSKGSDRRQGYLAVAMRLADRQRGPKGTRKGRR